MVKRGRRKPPRDKSQAPSGSTSKNSGGGGSDDGGEEMLIDNPIQPKLYCHGKLLFETRPTSDLSTPFYIDYGTEDNIQYSEVCETNVLDVYPQAGVRSQVDRKALHLIRYEYRLSEILAGLRITEYERARGEIGRLKSNLIREVIRGIMKEFCYLVKVAPNDPMYFQHADNYLIKGYDEYMATDGMNYVNNVITACDEFSTDIEVKFGWFNRTGGFQTTRKDKLDSLKILLSQIIVDDDDFIKQDVEWASFLASLNETDYEDAYKHPFLMHWDAKIDFVEYLHDQFNLNGVAVLLKARQVFNTVDCLEKDWQTSLLADGPIERVQNARITVHHDDDEEDMPEVDDSDEDISQDSLGSHQGRGSSLGGQSTNLGGQAGRGSSLGGQRTNLGGQAGRGSSFTAQDFSHSHDLNRQAGQGSSPLGGSGQRSNVGGVVGSTSSKGKDKMIAGRKPRTLTDTEKRCRLRSQRGMKFIKLIRNSRQHVSQVKWVDDGTHADHRYVNIKEEDARESLYRNRKHLYTRAKQALPEFWIQAVVAARNRGFKKY